MVLSRSFYFIILVICFQLDIWVQVFLSNTHILCPIVWFHMNYFYLIQLIIYSHSVQWFQIFLSDTNNSYHFKILFIFDELIKLKVSNGKLNAIKYHSSGYLCIRTLVNVWLTKSSKVYRSPEWLWKWANRTLYTNGSWDSLFQESL